eukprot:6178744-Pleurochrysis_carterae.AAC.1
MEETCVQRAACHHASLPVALSVTGSNMRHFDRCGRGNWHDQNAPVGNGYRRPVAHHQRAHLRQYAENDRPIA